MAIATGVFKKVSLKKQSALGTKAPAGSSGSAKYQRRVTSTLDLSKASFQSNEILSSQQVQDMRHGVKSVSGSLSQELSVGGHQLQLEAVLRAAAATGGSKTGTTIAATAGAAGSGNVTYADSANSLLTSGFKVGDVVDVSGFTTTGVANNKRAVVMTCVAGSMLVHNLDNTDGATKVAGDTVTIALVGKKIAVPLTSHTRDYFTVEHWFGDVAQSEQFTDCVFTGANINMPPTAMATVEFPVLGLNMETGTSEYFTSPAAETTGAILAGVNGAVIVDGSILGTVTGLSINIAGGHSAVGGVVGKTVDPDIFVGVLQVSGQMTVLFENATLRDKFINESLATVVAVLTADNTASSPFMSFVMSKVKFSGATKDDGTQGLTLTLPFTALQNTAGGAAVANLNTTISIQDSSFA